MTELDFSKLKVLVVDDNDFIRFTLKKHLSGFGVTEIAEAIDGFGGMQKLDEFKPDVAICDIKMEPVSGFDFLMHIRGKDSPYRKVPVIFLTSSAEPSDVKRALEGGVDAYLHKPVAGADLQQRIIEVIRQKNVDPNKMKPFEVD